MKEINFKIKNFKSIKEEVEFTIKQDEINFLIGRNGSGKTNFLEAISYIQDTNIEKAGTQTTSFYEGNNLEKLKQNVKFSELISQEEIEALKSILKSFDIKSQFISKLKLERTYSINEKSYYGNLYLNEQNEKTALAEIIEKILKAKEEVLGNKFIIKNGYYSLKSKNEIEQYLNDSEIEIHQKDVINNIIRKIKSIEDIFKKRPKISYIRNAAEEIDVLYVYNLDSLLSEKPNPELLSILSFIEINALKFAKEICNLSDSDKDLEEQENITGTLKAKANRNLTSLFEKFNIYALPEISINNKKLIIKVVNKKNYKYNAEATEINSSGYKSFFQIIFNLEIAKNQTGVTSIILADEPDKNLHPLLQEQLTDYIRNFLKENKNVFVVFTTHSPFLINHKKDNIKITKRNKDGSSYLIGTEDKKEILLSTGWYTLLMAEKLSKILPNDQIQLLKKKDIIYYEADNDDDFMMLKQKLYTQYTNYEFIRVSDIINDYSQYSLIDSLYTIEDLADIEIAHQNNEKVLILKKAYL